jgi:ERCC4-type nuclease
MTIKITVDYREQKLIDEMTSRRNADTIFKDVEIVTENLLLGDVRIVANDHTLLIERKTIDDLLSSIKDGRYEEQSYRLQTEPFVYYFIEGKVKKMHQTVYSAILSLNYFKGFSVIKTDDVKETASMILYFSIKLQKENSRKPYHKCSSSVIKNEVDEEESYASLIQKKKNENITVDNFAEIVLCQIPLVNHTYASIIMQKYENSLTKLIEALRENPQCLDNLTYTTNTNKVRKISKTCLQNISKFLLQQRPSLVESVKPSEGHS